MTLGDTRWHFFFKSVTFVNHHNLREFDFFWPKVNTFDENNYLLGFIWDFFEKKKFSQKIFYHNSIGRGLSINKLNWLLTSMILKVDTLKKNYHLCMTFFQLKRLLKYAALPFFHSSKKWKSRFYHFEIVKIMKEVLILPGKKCHLLKLWKKLRIWVFWVKDDTWWH